MTVSGLGQTAGNSGRTPGLTGDAVGRVGPLSPLKKNANYVNRQNRLMMSSSCVHLSGVLFAIQT